MPQTFKSLEFRSARAVGNAMNEKNDCSVVALAIAFDLDYRHAHDAMRAVGRKDRRGAQDHHITQAIELVGGKIERHEIFYKVDVKYGVESETDRGNNRFTVCRKRGLTPNNVTEYIDPTKRYLAYTKRHVFAIVEGRVHDWQEGRKFRIEELIEVSGC